MWQGTLRDRFDSAGPAGAVRIRVGERPHLSTVAIVVWKDEYQNNSDTFESVDAESTEDAAERTCLILEEAGFGTDYPNARVDFMHAETGKLLPAWSRTEKVNGTAGEEGPSEMGILADALRQNNVEMRRMFGMVCETLAAREERIDDDRDRLIESEISAVESRAEAELSQILFEEANGAEVQDPVKEQAGIILQGIAQQLFSGQANPRDTVLNILKSDASLTAQLAGDPEVVELFTRAMHEEAAAAQALEELAQTEAAHQAGETEIPEPPAPPAPMPE